MVKIKNSLFFMIILYGNIVYGDLHQLNLLPSNIDMELYNFTQDKISQGVDFTEEDLSIISNSLYAEYLYIEYALTSYPNKIFAPLGKPSKSKLVNSMNQLYVYIIQNNTDKIELLWDEFGIFSYYAYLISSQGEKSSDFELKMINRGFNLKLFYSTNKLFNYFKHKGVLSKITEVEDKIDYILSARCILGHVPLSKILINSEHDAYLFEIYNNLYPNDETKMRMVDVETLRFRILEYFIRNKRIDYLNQIDFNLAKTELNSHSINDLKSISKEIVSSIKNHDDLWYYTTNAHLFFYWTSKHGYR